MRFEVDYEKGDSRRPVMRALGVFLNEHLIGQFHGQGIQGIFVEFTDRPPKGRAPKARLLHGKFARVELAFDSKVTEDHRFVELEEAFELIFEAVRLAASIPLKRQGLGIDRDGLLRDLDALRAHLPRNEAALDAYLARSGEIDADSQLKLVRMEQCQRRDNARPLTRALSGVRIHGVGPCRTLDLHAAAFGETYGSLLRRAGVLTPSYTEIHIVVARGIEEALREQSLEAFYECAAAVLDIEAFEAAPSASRVALLAKAYNAALRSIAAIDHLEPEPIEATLEEVAARGLDRDLIAYERETRKFGARVLYNLTHGDGNRPGRVPYRLELVCHTSGRRGVVLIDDLDVLDAPYSFGKLRFTKTEVVLSAKTSKRAERAREFHGVPDAYRFVIEEVLDAGPEPTRTEGSVVGGRTVPILNR